MTTLCARILSCVLLLSSFPVCSGAGTNRFLQGVDSLREEAFPSPAVGVAALLFGPYDHLEDLFLPLHRDGRLSALTLVVPLDSELSPANLSSWKRYVASLSPGDAETFLLDNGSVHGTVLGLSVQVVSIKNWKRGAGSGPVILDLAFFPAMYRDEVRTPFVDLPLRFFATLDDRQFDTKRIRPWIAGRAEIPLERGYLPKLVSEILSDPDGFRERLPGKWADLRQGEYLAFFSANKEAIPHFERYLAGEPDDPSVLFRLAGLHLMDRDVEGGIRYLERAQGADPWYIRAFLESSLSLYRKGDYEAAERVIRAGLLRDPGFTDLKVGLGRVLLAQAMMMLPVDKAAAAERFEEIGLLGLLPEVYGQIRAEWEEARSAPRDGARPPMRGPGGHGAGGHGH